MVTGSKINIEDKRSPLEKGFNGENLPEIGGCNFFTGEYDSGTGHIGLNTDDPNDWKLFWQQALGIEPPAPLPKGAKAIMLAEHHVDDPIAFVPESVSWDGSNTSVKWQKLHLADPANPGAKSRYAILLIPASGVCEATSDVFIAEEQRKKAEQLAEDIKGFTEGSRESVVLMPVMRLKRKAEFSGAGI